MRGKNNMGEAEKDTEAEDANLKRDQGGSFAGGGA